MKMLKLTLLVCALIGVSAAGIYITRTISLSEGEVATVMLTGVTIDIMILISMVKISDWSK